MKKNTPKLLLIAVIVILAVLFFSFDLGQYFTLESLKRHQASVDAFYGTHRILAVSIYFLVYVSVTALSLPGAAVMTLAGGAIFGLGVGAVVISFASTIGATLAFLASRFLLRDMVEGRFGEKLATINQGVRKDGAFYLFTLRLVPIFPFFVINLAMGLTPIRTVVFYLVSQVGMLPGTLVYVNAGTQLASIESLQGILSPGLLFSFALLGIFPWIAKTLVAVIKRRRIYARWPRPAHYDYNLLVIGGGSAGLVAAYIAAAVKARVALVEKHKMGGDCLNTGCVPSKALIRSARMLSYARRAKEFGFEKTKIEYSFDTVMERVQQVIGKVAPHDSVERYTKLGVDVFQGEARITSPFTVTVDGKELTTRNIILATGAQPLVPPIPGLDQVDYLTSDTIWSLRKRPDRLVVLGGGPIGSELTQAFSRLGSRVTQVEMMDRILGREDPDVSERVRARFEAEGVRVLTGHKALRVERDAGRQSLICQGPDGEVALGFDAILVALGRRANTKGFGLEEIGVELDPNGTVAVDGLLRTNFPNIFASGDAAGPYQFTHTAAHQSWYATVNALFGRFKRFKVDYRVIPWATFTDPEVARVGLNQTEAAQKQIPYEVSTFNIDDLDRAIADSEDHGLVRVLTKPGSDKILGVTIVGAHAGDLISEFVLAMKHNLGLNKILGTIHIYPTLAEANKYVAGIWKRAHAPEGLLRWIGRYHAWLRS